MSYIPTIANCSLLPLLVLLSPWTFATFAAEAAEAIAKQSPFKIIFDGGSTGSRLHIFEFVADEDENDRDDAESSNVQCVRRGSTRANIPLSAFGRDPSEQTRSNPLDPTKVAAHLIPLFDYAAGIIPSEYYESTGVYYQATAGMRLLNLSEQEAVYDALYDGLIGEDSFVFTGFQRKGIATLSGEMEAYYGALAANFLQGIIDTELRLVSAQNSAEAPHHPVGALDMGGSSTQIVYIANQDEDDDETDSPTTTPRDGPTMCPVKQQPLLDGTGENTCRLSDEHFFSTSYLSYGVDQIRKRLWNTLVEESDSKLVSNPCANKGFKVEVNGHVLVGSGDTNECIRQMQRLIPHPDILHEWDSTVSNWTVGGVEHPPIRGKFLAMSLYFFALDSLRVFSKPSKDAHGRLNKAWPNPSIEELQNALEGLCSRDWQGDMELQEGVHAFTRKEVLPHRCLETVYMVTLLKDGFGFDPTSREITFTFMIDGDEVEWTLGLALAMNAEELKSVTVTTTTFDYNINETGNNLIFELEDQEVENYRMRVPIAHSFGVTMPPTHCC